MSQWTNNDILSSITLNNRGASATSVTGYSTNTLSADSGSVISALGFTITASTFSGANWVAGSGTSISPSINFSSEVSLGWYRSAASSMALSYGRIEEPSDAPASGTASGRTGQITWGEASGTTYLYICISTDSWHRTALNPF